MAMESPQAVDSFGHGVSMTKTRIEWTDEVWNPVTGCTKVSQGCKHCYAERQWPRLNAPGMPYAGRAFTDVQTHPERLDQPLRWKRPRRIFVNSMSDLFHEDVSFGFIDLVMVEMYKASQHTFQVLTKRPERMLEYMRSFECRRGIIPLPIPNVWLGVSVEDQATADERIPILLQTPAAVRWISAEPLLGRVDLCDQLGMWWNQTMQCFEATGHKINQAINGRGRIDWVVCGGESGPKARPMHPVWPRSLRDQCLAAGVPFLFKQQGEFTHIVHANLGIQPKLWVTHDGRNATMEEAIGDRGCWTGMFRVGKKRAGRLLDGKLWDEYPA